MITSIRHYGITVSNLENAVHFFRDILGLVAGPILTVKGERVNELLQMANVLLHECFLTTPDNGVVELIEYMQPRGEPINLKSCNFGVSHISFGVTNIGKMYEDLSAKGVIFNNRPQKTLMTGSGLNAGKYVSICYLKGPDNITIEFMEVHES
jgi:catechol 2,3-dioxygenase-like lactoylglutathione lyase family enzyme